MRLGDRRVLEASEDAGLSAKSAREEYPLTTRGRMFWTLRVFMPYYDSDAAVSALIDFCRKTHVDGVMLINSYGHFDPNHFTDDTLAERGALLEKVVPILRDAGMHVGINVQACIGMNQSPADYEDFGFVNQVDSTGKVNPNVACPLCDTFKSYLVKLIHSLAIPCSDYMFIDDDFTYKVEGMTCWCPLHMDAFSERIGQSISREEWLAEISASDYRPDERMQAWMDVQRGALLEGLRVCVETSVARNPKSAFGVMGINEYISCFGREFVNDLFGIIRSLTGREPLVRPNIGDYHDTVRTGIREQPVLGTRAVVGPDVPCVLEVDSGGPWTTSVTGAEHLRYRMERFAAIGETTQSLLLFPDSKGVRIDTDHPYAKILKSSRKRLDAIAELVGVGLTPIGVDCTEVEGFLNAKGVLPDYPDCRAPFVAPSHTLGRLGIALAPDRSYVPVLYDSQPWLIGPEKLDSILAKGGVIDLPALSSIHQAGMGDLVGGICIGKMESHAPVGVEIANHPLAGEMAGKYWPSWAMFHEGGQMLQGEFHEEDVLTWWVDGRFNRLGPAEVVIERDGRRFVLLAYNLVLLNRRIGLMGAAFIVNPVRRAVYRQFCEWVARGPLPAVVEDAFDVLITCLTSPQRDRTVLTLVNNGHNRYDPLVVVCSVLPGAWKTVRTVDSEGNITEVSLDIHPHKGYDRITLPASLAPEPFEVRVLAFER